MWRCINNNPDCDIHYDGGNDGVFNYSGKTLVSYALLLSFTFNLITGKGDTFDGFVEHSSLMNKYMIYLFSFYYFKPCILLIYSIHQVCFWPEKKAIYEQTSMDQCIFGFYFIGRYEMLALYMYCVWFLSFMAYI
jgi:hypothetical protein